MLACGTSYHAGLIGRYLLEEWARFPCESDIASEWRYRHAGDRREHAGGGRSPQSGRDDRHAGGDEGGARRAAPTCSAITNVMGSQMTRECDSVLYTRAGLEIGVAATKTFTAQVTLMYLLALKLGLIRGTIDAGPGRAAAEQVRRCPTWRSGRSTRERSGRADRRRATGRTSSSSTWAATSACRSRSRARSS